MERLIRRIRPGGYTYELRAEFEYYLTGRGMEGSIFPPVITSGANIDYLHYIPDSVMNDGELVLVDLGAEYKYYGADICRVYPVNGGFTPEQRMWYELLLGVYREAVASIRPGVTLREVGDLGKKLLAGRLKANKTISDDSELSKYLNHGIAHFLGMDNHDPGEDCALEAGMLMAFEPGLYFKDLGFGMRIEDSILITERGNEILTDGLASDVETIEYMLAASLKPTR
jgi:Xaa-Pro aminopeptidase